MGVTRLSLGVENFDDHILELNGRAHRSPEVFKAYDFARSLDFPQINIDLIAGMLGETEANWQSCVEKTLALDPDSVTIYQMELPYNTTISNDLLKGTGRFEDPVANWATKRRWVDEAFAALERAGYHVGSAYTAAKDPAKTRFVYRDRLWEGADLVGLGVASFGHVSGVPHAEPRHLGDLWRRRRKRRDPPGPGLSAHGRGADDPRAGAAAEARLHPALVLPREIRSRRAFRGSKSRSPRSRPTATWPRPTRQAVTLSRSGLLRVDVLLPRFFLPAHAGIRYT
jgi:oxygen-independent coproporphyrinogen-3 oxidase